jgi:hypothetical protein
LLKIKQIYQCFDNACCLPFEETIPIGYEVLLGLNCNERPMRINVAASSDEEFLKYMIKDLQTRRLHFTRYFKGYKVDDLEDVPCHVY